MASEQRWVDLLEKRKALWLHYEDRGPHVILEDGKHANGVFDPQVITNDPILLGEAADDLMKMLLLEGFDPRKVDRVICSENGNSALADEIAKLISIHKYASHAKSLELERGKVQVGETVLLVEDVFSTILKVEIAAGYVKSSGATLLPFLPVQFNSSFLKDANGRKIISLVHRPITIWPVESCLLCKAGSEVKNANSELLNCQPR